MSALKNPDLTGFDWVVKQTTSMVLSDVTSAKKKASLMAYRSSSSPSMPKSSSRRDQDCAAHEATPNALDCMLRRILQEEEATRMQMHYENRHLLNLLMQQQHQIVYLINAHKMTTNGLRADIAKIRTEIAKLRAPKPGVAPIT